MATTTTGFTLNLGNTPSTVNTGISLGTGITQQATPTFGGFSTGSFAAAAATTSVGFSLPTTTPAAASSGSTPTLNFNVNPSTATPAATTAAAAATSSPISFGLSLPVATKTVSFNFNTPSTTGGSSTVSSTKTTPSLATSATSATPGAAAAEITDKPINYVQLNDLTHKWIAEFGDLQKMLMNQTAELVNRDVVLTSNHDKIEKFVNSIRNLKSEQTQVEQQLDFILSQQRDLEECLSTLEEEVSSYFPDLPADDMYKLAENIDSRLKKTLETSKEIITKINDKNRSSENVTNPMVAIGRILNHHTNSIHMLENSTAEAQLKLNDLLKLYQQYA